MLRHNTCNGGYAFYLFTPVIIIEIKGPVLPIWQTLPSGQSIPSFPVLTGTHRFYHNPCPAWCKEQYLKFDAINDNLDNLPEIIEFYGNNSRKIIYDYYINDLMLLPNIIEA